MMNIALLIDCENARAESIHGILSELSSKGVINIRRAYGNWKNLPGWEAKLHPLAIQPVQQFAYTNGKNATDMCMAIDAIELHYSEKVDCFALVTSDCDFTPLVLKLLTKGRTVIGFGEAKTPDPFRRACSTFIQTDNFREPSQEHPESSVTTRKSRNELRGDTELMNVLRNAIENMKADDGWTNLSRAGQYIANNSSLSPKNYGYASWSGLIRGTEYFDEELRETHPYFRTRKAAKAAG